MAYIDRRAKASPYKFGFAEFVNGIAASVGPAAVGYQQDLLQQKMSPEPRVLVLRNNPQSRGHWDQATNVIVLQEAEPLALLDTLLFETGNARRKKEYAAVDKAKTDPQTKGYKKAELEYDVDVEYIDGLKRIHRAGDLDELVAQLGIPRKFLVKQGLSAAQSKSSPPYVDMPSTSDLPTQAHRQALWFWKTSEWDVKERRHIWVIENHTTLGMGASNMAYASK